MVGFNQPQIFLDYYGQRSENGVLGAGKDCIGTQSFRACYPAGYAALLDAFGIAAPTPITLCSIGTKHRVRKLDQWRVFTPRHSPPSSLAGHLVFVLKHEGLNPCILKRLFQKVGPEPLRQLVQGNSNRRLCSPTLAFIRVAP